MFKYSMLAMALLFALSGSAMATTVTLNPSDDSYVYSHIPDGNYGHDIHAYTGTNGSISLHHLYSMLRFDLSAYSGATINNASLFVHVNAYSGTFPTPGMKIGRYSGSWNEHTITWDNRPDLDDAHNTAPPVMGWWSIDVSFWTQAWVSGSHDNYGMCLYTFNTGPVDWLRWYTKEYNGSTYHPKLVLDYTPLAIESASLGEIKAAFK